MNSYAMYTADGDRAVQHMFDTLRERLKADVKLLSELHDDLATHRPGYTDTAVRESVGHALAELLYEATEYFGEGLKIDGKSFQDYVTRHFVEREGGVARILQQHGLKI